MIQTDPLFSSLEGKGGMIIISHEDMLKSFQQQYVYTSSSIV